MALWGLRVETARTVELWAQERYPELEIAAWETAFVFVLRGAFEVDSLAEVFAQNT